jgi:hypothetical protein
MAVMREPLEMRAQEVVTAATEMYQMKIPEAGVEEVRVAEVAAQTNHLICFNPPEGEAQGFVIPETHPVPEHLEALPQQVTPGAERAGKAVRAVAVLTTVYLLQMVNEEI